jgi:GNAT superfamily N-acetyltransferase
MAADRALGRHRWVGLVDGVCCGSATARYVEGRPGGREVDLSVAVDPDHGSRGVGTALLKVAMAAFPDASWLRADSRDDPIAMSFAMRNMFVPEAERAIAFVDPRTVAAARPLPRGLRATTLDALPDLRMLLETNNLCATDDPTGVVRHRTMYQLRADWWDWPDNAPDLSFGVLASGAHGPVLASFASVRVDRQRQRAWSTETATHPSYRGKGLATWAKRRVLNALAEAGVTSAWTAHDPANAAMAAIDQALGYRPVTRSILVARRGGRRPGPPAA